MDHRIRSLIDRLEEEHSLSAVEYALLVAGRTPEAADYLARKADRARRRVFQNHVLIRGLLEIGNVCQNDCLYCGIRRSNPHCERYLLSHEQILDCCRTGYELGFRTFVLQGGEIGGRTDQICDLVRKIKGLFPDCAVTLSLGEYPTEDYRAMREAGADRYLLRHETADKAHYRMLHPPGMSFENRMRCLSDLRALGFQTGCGFMVGSPGQTPETLAKDLKFVEEFAPQMCGIGPFLPQKDTPFAKMPPGSADLTTYLLSILRLIRPTLLLPSTTALSTLCPDGRARGILAGANVVMPNLSPPEARRKYVLYDGKRYSGSESAQHLYELERELKAIGFEIEIGRGDAP